MNFVSLLENAKQNIIQALCWVDEECSEDKKKELIPKLEAIVLQINNIINK